MKNIKKFRDVGIIWLITSLILVAFTRDFVISAKLVFAFTTIIFLPGYAITSLLLKEWGELEKAIIAIFVGIGPVAIITYILSMIGLHPISQIYSVIFGIISLMIIIIPELKKK